MTIYEKADELIYKSGLFSLLNKLNTIGHILNSPGRKANIPTRQLRRNCAVK